MRLREPGVFSLELKKNLSWFHLRKSRAGENLGGNVGDKQQGLPCAHTPSL